MRSFANAFSTSSLSDLTRKKPGGKPPAQPVEGPLPTDL
jgi:hypothetical protein